MFSNAGRDDGVALKTSMARLGKILAAIFCAFWLYKAVPFLVLAVVEGYVGYGVFRGTFFAVLLGVCFGYFFILPPLNYLIEFSTGKLNSGRRLHK